MSIVAIQGGATGTGTVTVVAPSTSTNRTLTLPDQTATVLTNSAEVLNIGSGQVYKDASGNVGIGNTSPASYFSSADNLVIGTTSGNNGVTILGGSAATAVLAFGYATGTAAGDGSNRAKIYYDGPSDTLRMSAGGSLMNSSQFVLDASGNLLVGGTDVKGAVTVGKAAPNSAYGQICALSPTAGDSNISGMSVVKYANDSTTSQVLIRFLMNQGSTGQGQINANGANTAAFGSYSDSRLKENIVDLPSQLDNIMALRPVEYDYIESMGGGHQIGFVAQEVQVIYPDLVAENEDGMLTLTDMNKNDARLIKCIQEQQTLITALTARITALETAA